MATNNIVPILVRNRNNGVTTYQLPELHIVRSFGVNETKKIPYDELLTLYYAPGGQYMLENLLVIEDKEVLKALDMHVEPEYFYTEDMVKDMLLNGSYDAFADFLDFAPEGAIEMAKEIAVKEQIPDSRKREMVEQKTGFSIDNAIKVNKIMDAPVEDENKTEGDKKRRVAVPETKAVQTPVRRTTPMSENKVAATTTATAAKTTATK